MLIRAATRLANLLNGYFRGLQPTEEIQSRQMARSELAQAKLRVIITGLSAIAMMIGAMSDGFEPQRRWTAICIIATFCIFAIGSMLSFWMLPRPSIVRRLLGLVNDFSGLTSIMIVGGAMFIPAYAIILWVTVGYGLRYGLPYLFGATFLSLLSMGIIYMFTPYWQENPYILATLALTSLLIPAYAYGLLDNLRKARDSAAKANLAKSRFLAYASHDLRQPVQAASLLVAHLRNTKLQPDQTTIVDDIADALRSVTDLFQSLLDVSTLDSGGITPRTEHVDLNALLKEIVHRNAAAADKAGVHLKFASTTASIITDRQLLAVILQNVISNALKYASGKPVLIGCKRHNQCITLLVCDRGPGIADHHIDHIFDDFYRGRPASNIEGMGLGLPIAKRLADLLGLEIRVRSVCGSGTTVFVKGLQTSGDRSMSQDHLRATAIGSDPL